MLIKWDTPFARHTFPSVWLNVNTNLANVHVYVEADKVWELSFNDIVALKICEEEFDENRRFHIERDEENLCSYMWQESEWLSEFTKEHTEDIKDGALIHYVLLGGDHNIEILAIGGVTINESGYNKSLNQTGAHNAPPG